MKITIYELLGMIKDGEVPKKIIYNGYNYLYHTDYKSYYRSVVGSNWIALTTDFSICTILNDEVEILEEENKIPEKLIPTSLKGIDDLNEKINVAHIDTISAIGKINEIIDYLKSKGDE